MVTVAHRAGLALCNGPVAQNHNSVKIPSANRILNTKIFVNQRPGTCSFSLRNPSSRAASSLSKALSQDETSASDLSPDGGEGTDGGPGTVYLVGTGPGDPELLTLKAYRLMQTVEVVLYDRLVSDDILNMIHPGAIMVYVGKESGYHTRTQEEIHQLLLKYAGEGQSVLRLKGGDPFIFGRGGEEQQFLTSQGIDSRVVPGITAAAGICAELGIPLTHRGVATGVRYMTGHTRDGAEHELSDSLAECRDPKTTLVFYMGLQTLPDLRTRLMAAGVDPDLPAVAIERGTTPEQREVWAPLSSFVEGVQEKGLQSPTLIIMGQVVALGKGWEQHNAVPMDLPCNKTSQESKEAKDQSLVEK